MMSDEDLMCALRCGNISMIKDFCGTHHFYIGPKLVPLLSDRQIHPRTVDAVRDHIQRFYRTEVWWDDRCGRHKVYAHLSIHNRYY